MMANEREDLVLLDEEEFVVKSKKASPEDVKFDQIVGALEDLLLDPEFLELQNGFVNEHAHHFTQDDENKLIYTEIFKNYTTKIENFIIQKLKSELPWFDMKEFLRMIENRQDQIDGDVFDVLATLGDFQAFKEMMLSYKQEQDGTALDLSGLIVQTSSRH